MRPVIWNQALHVKLRYPKLTPHPAETMVPLFGSMALAAGLAAALLAVLTPQIKKLMGSVH